MFWKRKRADLAAGETITVGPVLALSHPARAQSTAVVDVPLNLIDADPDNGRGNDVEEFIQELADSIREQGVLQAILLRPYANGRYKLIAGERRVRAAIVAGLSVIPAVIKTLTDAEAVAIQIIENEQRKDLDPVTKALKVRGYVESIARIHPSNAQQKAAEQLGKSPSWVSRQLALLDYPDDLLALVRAGKVKDLERIAQINRLKGERRRAVLAAYQDGTFTPDMLKRKRQQREPKPHSKETASIDSTPERDPIATPIIFALSGRAATLRLLRAIGYDRCLSEPLDYLDDTRLAAHLAAADDWLQRAALPTISDRQNSQ